MRTIAAVLALSLAPVSHADRFTVDASDPNADFQDLQEALDQVPPNSTLLLRGQFLLESSVTPLLHFTIRKSVVLIGDSEDAKIEQRLTNYDYFDEDAAIVIDAVGEDVVLTRIEIEGAGTQNSASDYVYGCMGLSVERCGTILVDQCRIRGGDSKVESSEDNGPDGGAAIGIAICDQVTLISSRLRGGEGAWAATFANYVNAGDGGAGVSSCSPVVLKDCDVRGGDGGDMFVECDSESGAEGFAGRGGDGVRSHSMIWHAHSSVNGGDGGVLYICTEEYPEKDGEDFAGEVMELLDSLSLWEWSFFIGSDAVLEGTGTPRSSQWIFFGFDVQSVTNTKAGPFFIGWPWSVISVRASSGGTWLLEAGIPFDYDLVGLSMYFQAFDLSANQISCLEAGVIGS